MMKKLPELLCPAGSPEAFDAAIEGGADAIYLGGAAFNARMHAKNFGGDDLRSAVLRAHAFGVKVYLTLNTLVTDRELPAYLEAAGEAARAGVDALIVADLGGAAAIHRVFPELELHASTQMSGHNAAMGKMLQGLGFSRMVVARETSSEDIRRIVSESPIEVEAFIHGALCVSHSGQCLFSSVVGGRSGNRGECAQPCRLPFSCTGCSTKARGGDSYPLSLKDLSLAMHLPELVDMGVASLKIEGRMKAPEYVRDTARVWRRLLDECRGATPAEMRELADVFSRGGFTDGYYTKRIGRSMLGVRSEGDKSRTRALEPFAGITRRVPLSVWASIKADRPIEMTVESGGRRVTVLGDIPSAAQTAPLTYETVQRNLSKFGATCYAVGSFALELDEGLMLPISRLNDLRRRAIAALEESADVGETVQNEYQPKRPAQTRNTLKSARFYSAEQITKAAKGYFDRIYLPLDRFSDAANGVVMPPVIFDGDLPLVREMLASAKSKGAKYALVGNLGHLSLVLEAGLEAVGDYRLNLCNAESVAQMESLGVKTSILSPELTLPQIRDIGGNTAVIVYGRLPLMTLEKCVIREIADCNSCADGRAGLRDRRGVEFPVLREWEHRNVIYNSIPTCMSDREDALVRANVTARHFLFSTETPREVDAVIEAHETRTALRGNVRRI